VLVANSFYQKYFVAIMVIRVIIVVNLLDIYYKIESMVSPANEQFGEAMFRRSINLPNITRTPKGEGTEPLYLSDSIPTT
jgi:hypothetical protein